ncbi:RusA family crossover junction endodeoxyribonuclease [Lysobacter capsici]|uniref:RusA family crossover junction endodeoxyribonuclease n=1 Tax=Lysobacter capsici TaxID=435897 RepID=UPI001BFFFE16|nr:RusA family crossover junction endodeoxyribonuclease [Lysobacter capsici]QWF19284.1 RusA family crossover junction endodeoxyribonuclease [Lysobacter capsici]
MSAITLVLPYPISANRYWATTTIRGRAITYVTKEAKQFRADVANIARMAGLRTPLDGRVALVLRLYPQRPQDWAKRARKNPDCWDDDVRCIDLGNAEKVLSDALNGIAWVDDRQLRRIELIRCEPDGDGRVEVTIEPLQRSLVAPVLFGEVAA